MTWFGRNNNKNPGRERKSKSTGRWAGRKRIQSKVNRMEYSTILQVSNSKGGRLIKRLAKMELKLAMLD